jgi:type IV pilus assembly protein PilM
MTNMAFSLNTVFSSFKKASVAQPVSVVGVDFGTSSIKVVELELVEEVISLKTYGELQLGPYGDAEMGSSIKLPTQKRTEALVDVLRESEISAKNAVFSIPLSNSFITIVSLAAKKDEDIAPRVNVEARKYIPVPITDVALEWTELEPIAGQPPLTREVLLAAIQNETLVEVRKVLSSVQMAESPLEIEVFSTIRAVTKSSDTSLAVIDIGADISKLYITESGLLRRLHRVHTGGSSATKTMTQKFRLSFEDAENLKRNYTPEISNASEIKKIMSNTFERSLQEFKRVIDQYELRTGAPIERIVLSGGTALFPDFVAYVSYVFDREVVLTNAFSKVAYPAFMEDTLKSISPVFTVALGAALRQFE